MYAGINLNMRLVPCDGNYFGRRRIAIGRKTFHSEPYL